MTKQAPDMCVLLATDIKVAQHLAETMARTLRTDIRILEVPDVEYQRGFKFYITDCVGLDGFVTGTRLHSTINPPRR